MILVSDYNLNYQTMETGFWNIYHHELVILDIKKMKPMKASDHDSIVNKIIHLCPETFAENLFMKYNNAILKEVYPNAIKIAKVIALTIPNGVFGNNSEILLIRNLGTNFSEILSKIYTFSFNKMHLKTSSAKWRQCCLGLNVLTCRCRYVTMISTFGIHMQQTFHQGT